MKAFFGVLFFFGACTASAQLAFNDDVTFDIVGGTEAETNEFPSTVSVQTRGRHQCGGTLVAKNWVLSAAHCYQFVKPEKVRVGATDLSDDTQGETVDVLELVIHPEFGKLSSISADFALIKIAETEKSYPVAHLNEVEPDEMKFAMFTVVGWGATSEAGFGRPDILQKADLPLVGREKCNKNFKNYNPHFQVEVDELMFCAGVEGGGKDSCEGDSGGPLYMWNEDAKKYILAGVVSWGIGCARPNLAGVYSDVSEVHDWIDKTVMGDQLLACLQ